MKLATEKQTQNDVVAAQIRAIRHLLKVKAGNVRHLNRQRAVWRWLNAQQEKRV